MLRISDEDLEYWGEIFVRKGLGRYVRFDTFIRAPRTNLLMINSGEFRPLLARQRDVQARLDGEAEPLPVEREIEDLPQRNGAPVERLRHHRHPKRTFAAYFTPGRSHEG